MRRPRLRMTVGGLLATVMIVGLGLGGWMEVARLRRRSSAFSMLSAQHSRAAEEMARAAVRRDEAAESLRGGARRSAIAAERGEPGLSRKRWEYRARLWAEAAEFEARRAENARAWRRWHLLMRKLCTEVAERPWSDVVPPASPPKLP